MIGSTGPLHEAVFGRLVLAQMQDALIVADTAGVIRVWNRAAEVLFGFSSAEAVGSKLSLIVPEKFRRSHDEGYRRAVTSGQLRTAGRILTTRAEHKFGCRLYVDFSFALLKSESGQVLGVIAVGRDATEKHLEALATKVRARQPVS